MQYLQCGILPAQKTTVVLKNPGEVLAVGFYGNLCSSATFATLTYSAEGPWSCEFYAHLREAVGIIHAHRSRQKESLYFQWVRDLSPGASPLPSRNHLTKKYSTASALRNLRKPCLTARVSAVIFSLNSLQNRKLIISSHSVTCYLYKKIKYILGWWVS